MSGAHPFWTAPETGSAAGLLGRIQCSFLTSMQVRRRVLPYCHPATPDTTEMECPLTADDSAHWSVRERLQGGMRSLSAQSKQSASVSSGEERLHTLQTVLCVT